MNHPSSSTATSLTEGQALRISVSGGTQIVVTQGRIMLVEAPAWLGETMVARRTPLVEGRSHRIEKAGWIEIVAESDAELTQWSEASSWEMAKKAASALKARAAQVLAQIGLANAKVEPLP